MGKYIECLKKCLLLSLISIFNYLPIKKNKLLMLSYYGSQYSCNPKYLTEYIVNNCPKGKFDIVWAFSNLKSKEHLTGFRKVRNMSLKFFYELCTSKVIITNFRTTDYFKKRRNQYYIQTWHSSLRLKQIEKDAERYLSEEYIKMAQKDSSKCDLLISGCEYSTNIFRRAFWYDGRIFENGTPRNDIFFDNQASIKNNIRTKLNLPKDNNVVLYAPTFRKNNNLKVYNLEILKILNTLTIKFDCNWIFLLRLHPHLISESQKLQYDYNIIDVTSYDDIQELLCITDILITDYSSLMFDFLFTRKPCFLYVPDVKDYCSNDRPLYFNLGQLPFISAVSNEDLVEGISSFDYLSYSLSIDNFLRKIGTFEKGEACNKLVKHITKVCFEGDGI